MPQPGEQGLVAAVKRDKVEKLVSVEIHTGELWVIQASRPGVEQGVRTTDAHRRMMPL
jgi:hypothetical protein